MSQTVWTRRSFLGSAAMVTAATALRAQNNRTAVEGAARTGTVQSLGIPYAKPPVAPLRFRPPVPVGLETPALGHYALSAVQSGRKDVGEDCLYLNVFAPDPTTQGKGPFPVFMWIHGGGFTGGSPNEPLFDGSVFAKQGIVIVTVAYRLGVFGFMDWSPLLGPGYADSANNGMRDVVCALQWVQSHIGTFGGDPKQVTIGGESAGAKLTDMLMGVEAARPLFHAAISESGGAERINDSERSKAVTNAFAEQLHGIADLKADALTVPADVLLKAQNAMIQAWPGDFPLRPQQGGAFMPGRAVAAIAGGSSRGKRLLIGTNRDESVVFLREHAPEPVKQQSLATATVAQFGPVLDRYRALYPQMTPAQLNIRAVTAEEYWVPSIRVAEALLKGGGSAWFYRLDEEGVSGQYKGHSYHGYDVGYVWDRLATEEPPAAHTLALQIHNAWAAFIKGGAPAASGLPTWPQWNPKTRPTMILSTASKVEQQPYEAELRLWDDFRFA